MPALMQCGAGREMVVLAGDVDEPGRVPVTDVPSSLTVPPPLPLST